MMLIALDEKTHSITFDTFAVHSFSPHPQCCEPQTLFTQGPTIDKSCEERRMPSTKNGILQLSSTFCTWFASFRCEAITKPQVLIQLKTRALLKFRLFAAINQQKTVLLQQRQVLSREFEKLGDFLPNRPCPPSVKRRWSQLFLTSRQQSARKFDFRSRFLCFQTANQKIRN